jgi:hypothetical protein
MLPNGQLNPQTVKNDEHRDLLYYHHSMHPTRWVARHKHITHKTKLLAESKSGMMLDK